MSRSLSVLTLLTASLLAPEMAWAQSETALSATELSMAERSTREHDQARGSADGAQDAHDQRHTRPALLSAGCGCAVGAVCCIWGAPCVAALPAYYYAKDVTPDPDIPGSPSYQRAYLLAYEQETRRNLLIWTTAGAVGGLTLGISLRLASRVISFIIIPATQA